MSNEFSLNDDGEKPELKAHLDAIVEALGGLGGPIGDSVKCYLCGVETPVLRDGDLWSVDCRCGATARGQAPQPKH